MDAVKENQDEQDIGDAFGENRWMYEVSVSQASMQVPIHDVAIIQETKHYLNQIKKITRNAKSCNGLFATFTKMYDNMDEEDIIRQNRKATK